MISPRTILATWFGAGRLPWCPGTFGTLAALPVVALLWWLGSVWLHALAALAAVVVGLWASAKAPQRFGAVDPGCVVIDEVAGTLIATAGVAPGPFALVAAFALFRTTDIAKPWPCRQLQSLPGSWGIMIDDVVAGLYANAALQAGLYIGEHWT